MNTLYLLFDRVLRFIYKILPLSFAKKYKIKNWLLQSKSLHDFIEQCKSVPRCKVSENLLVCKKYIQDVLDRSMNRVKLAGVHMEYTFKTSVYVNAENLSIRAIAFYLPQFHPIPENDRWWGAGFTEWTNVTKAAPQFLGHYQPHLPGELGFYDLRSPWVMQQQAALAKQYGIYGFCFHYYWFNGKKLLEQPVKNFLKDDSVDINFCLCWANENWTRRWDGADHKVLIAQQHTPEDDLNFINELASVFSDSRYICIDNKPLLIVYRPMLLPSPKDTTQRWRSRIKELGFNDLYLVAALTFETPDDCSSLGFDATVEFPPHHINLGGIYNQLQIVNQDYRGHIFSYQQLVENKVKNYDQKQLLNVVKFRGIMPSWDNEARKPGAGTIFYGATPVLYSRWLRKVCEATALQRPQERVFFINAWNEWAEGAHLEPDRKFGYGYLQATATVLADYYQDVKRRVCL